MMGSKYGVLIFVANVILLVISIICFITNEMIQAIIFLFLARILSSVNIKKEE